MDLEERLEAEIQDHWDDIHPGWRSEDIILQNIQELRSKEQFKNIREALDTAEKELDEKLARPIDIPF